MDCSSAAKLLIGEEGTVVDPALLSLMLVLLFLYLACFSFFALSMYLWKQMHY